MNELTKVEDLETPEARRQALLRALSDSVAAVLHAARILHRMEKCGDDLHDLSPTVLRLLRQVRKKEVLPEVVTHFNGRLQRRLAQLPIEEQRKVLAPGYRVAVVTSDGTAAKVLLDHLDEDQQRVVFGANFIRKPAEQKAFLAAYTPTARSREGTRIDKKNATIVFRGHKITKQTLLEWLREL